MLQLLIEHLQQPTIYPHPIKYFRIIETHISVVLLTGDYAYKIKKPLDMEFLDFSTLEKRRYFCYEELRINKRYSPDLYVEVVAIRGDVSMPVFSGEGDVIEYAIKMREFPQEQLFHALLQQGKLTSFHFVQLAEQLAIIHQQSRVSELSSPYGTPEQLFFPVQQNFDQIKVLLKSEELLKQLVICEHWAQQQYQQLYEIFQERKAQGFIRECHGDLHLRNIVLYQEKPMIFDAIEFNPDLQWTDVMGDVGFLTMDLRENQQSAFAYQFLNAYLTSTGDYAGLRVLRFYQAYRAVVRAKIALMQFHQNNDASLLQDYQRSIQLAEYYTITDTPRLIIMHGIAGSGKTTRARELISQFHAIHIRSDVERKRLLQEDFYNEKNILKVYEYLLQLTTLILKAGYSVVVDATFLKKSQRVLFQQLAENLQLPFSIALCVIDEETHKKWLHQRPQEYSDADWAVSQQQQVMLEPLTLEEQEKML
jgi:aminoglycoside phosphotransferase family enzyme/predicted kinase